LREQSIINWACDEGTGIGGALISNFVNKFKAIFVFLFFVSFSIENLRESEYPL
jgi:hypothetical protein